MTKYVKIDRIVRYFPNGYEAAKEVAGKSAKPAKPKGGKKA